MFDKEVFDSVLKSAKQIGIYGAGIIAFNIKTALEDLYVISVKQFYVTQIDNNEHYFGGIVPKQFDENLPDIEMLILVATPNEYHHDIEENLKKRGFTNYILVNQDIEYYIMGQYLKKSIGIATVEDILQEGIFQSSKTNTVEVYMAKSIYDRPLKQKYKLPQYIIPVQAGKAQTNQKLLPICDDMGQNISQKNRNYSELSVTYWAWKNRNADYQGICHYRRMFELTDDEMRLLMSDDVDAILPLPFVCEPDASEQYKRYITQSDFKVLIQVIRDIMPDKMGEIEEILKGRYLYNYNMLIAKREIFEDYCKFLFSILEKVENYFESKKIARNDRYLGYLGEILTSTYFLLNKRKLKIVHAKKVWMV